MTRSRFGSITRLASSATTRYQSTSRDSASARSSRLALPAANSLTRSWKRNRSWSTSVIRWAVVSAARDSRARSTGTPHSVAPNDALTVLPGATPSSRNMRAHPGSSGS
ncbi:hypothetical protein JOD54_003613 [Actinokineospora baliensis]|uniref:hypothetical protein n=1 Tax=Actinokineospora baliensis TaxID=547056 RepID=UPI001EF97FDD|nr:hypothetical protein [Actinokineospora baliensis]MBM7773409.1 hypothetical protein [Actinokineospora baliensis]